MPVFLFVVMLLPRIKACSLGQSATVIRPGGRRGIASPPAGAPAGWPVVSLLTLLFLIVVCSNLVVDAADWGYRLMFEAGSLP